NSANCFWKSAFWTRRINDPPPAATTFSWTPPNATEWILRNSKRPWQRNLLRNETKRRKAKQSRRAAGRGHRSNGRIALDSGGVRFCTPPLLLDRRPGATVSTVYSSDR